MSSFGPPKKVDSKLEAQRKVLEERRFMRAISDSRGGKERGTSAGVKDGSSESDKEKG